MRSFIPAIALISSVSLAVAADNGTDAYKSGDYATALAQWKAAADQGEVNAQYDMGLLYAGGLGVPQDAAKAADFYKKAADEGNVNAMYNLGVLYMNGNGVNKDVAQAETLFRTAAEQGDMNAAHILGDILYDRKDYDGAREWFTKAASAGIPDAQFGLGLLYDMGQGVPQDFNKALDWYLKAADQGSAAAICNIAVLYYNGQGVPADRMLAHRYFLIATDMGEPRAKNLIEMTTNKLSKKQIEQCSEEADKWMRTHPVKTEPPPVPMPTPVPASL